jgi:hypothetical protein
MANFYSGSVGTKFQQNVEMLGGYFSTGSNGQFTSLPVSSSDVVAVRSLQNFGSPGAVGPLRRGGDSIALSASFSGSSGSIIQALNYLHAKAVAGAGDVTAGTVAGDNNVAFWSDASGKIIDGDADFTFDGAALTFGAGTAGSVNFQTTTTTINGTGVLSIDSAGNASHIKHTSTAGQDFTVAMDGNVDASLILSSTGTAADALQIIATQGGMDLSVQSSTAGDDIDIQGGASVNISGAEADREAVKITSGATAGGAKMLVANADGIAVVGNIAEDTYLKVIANSTAGSELVQIVNADGDTDGSDDAGAIELSAASGGIGLAWADTKSLWAEGGDMVFVANENPASPLPVIKLHADAGANQTIQLLNDEGTTTGAEGSGAIDIEATVGGIGLHAADDKAIWIEGGTAVVTANQNAADAIKLHADAGSSQTITLLNDAGTAVG